MNLLYNYITNNKSPPARISSEGGPLSCRNVRGRCCGGWTTPLSCVSSDEGVVVASIALKHKTEEL